MTNEELKKALFEETPVVFDGIKYAKITAIIYRKKENGVAVSAELLDRCRNSVTIADAEMVEN